MARTDNYLGVTTEIDQIKDRLKWDMAVPADIGSNTLQAYAEMIGRVLGPPPYLEGADKINEWKYNVLGFLVWHKDMNSTGKTLPEDIMKAIGVGE